MKKIDCIKKKNIETVFRLELTIKIWMTKISTQYLFDFLRIQ